MTKIINGSPQPGHPAPTELVSATDNADDRQPEPKLYRPGVINGSPQPGHPAPTELAGGGVSSDD